MKDRYEWVYIVFISDFTEVTNHKEVFDDMQACFQQLKSSERIKVILIENSFITLRPLLPSKRILKLSGSPKRRLRLFSKSKKKNERGVVNNPSKKDLFACKVTLHESCSDKNENIGFKQCGNPFDYWQKAFDFILQEFKADNYILHTTSHSNGFEINMTDQGFVMNGCGNLLKANNKFTAYQSAYFKKFLKRKTAGKKSTLFLSGFQKLPDHGAKRLKKLTPQKFQLKKWSVVNSSNGLLLYDFAEYLNSKNIRFKFLFLQNCAALLLENIYYLKNAADILLGTTGDISKFFKAYGIIYESVIQHQEIEKIKDEMKDRFKKLMVKNNNVGNNLLMVETQGIDHLFTRFSKAFLFLDELYLKDEIFRNSRIPFLIPDPGIPIQLVSDEENLQYFDVVELLKVFAGDNKEAVELVSGFAAACNKFITPLQSLSDNNHPSILYPYRFRYQFLSHLRSLFRTPYNNFNEKTHYSTFIGRLFFQYKTV